MAFSMMSNRQKQKFKESAELDLAYGVAGLGRFRVNVFQQRGNVGLVLRVVPTKIRNFDELNLPKVVNKICEERRGLVLVTGTTGSGKSTTLAAMVDRINAIRTDHIITVEDPIEFLHRDKRGIVNQREVEVDTHNFSVALRAALRQDPDVILVGEMRDLETIQAALTIAETGHLVLATLHTNSAAETINRIIDVFPSNQQSQVRAQLAFVLEGIITQTLLQKAKGRGRVMAAEILVVTPAIRALIRDDKAHQIYSLMQGGKKFGMQTLNDSLYQLYVGREVSLDECMRVSGDHNEFMRMIGQTPHDDVLSAAGTPGGTKAGAQLAGRR
jgi:twitching motility protein PilT